MKATKLLFSVFALVFLMSCSIDDSPQVEPISLDQLLNEYDLWYIDYGRSTGTGDVPFVPVAFTLSFLNGNMYANNNLVGIGTTGNGLGIKVGYYDTYNMTLETYHDLDGRNDFVVTQLNTNAIQLYNSFENVTYYLEGYQVDTFDYDQLFYDNLDYFLQEYDAWEKTYVSVTGDLNEFDDENYLTFFNDNGLTFLSSIDTIGTDIEELYWDFEGIYDVPNDPKVLTLDYDIGDIEKFDISVINDEVIELYHTRSGTTYEFTGRGYIPFKKNSSGKKHAETVRREAQKRTKVESRIKLGEKHLK